MELKKPVSIEDVARAAGVAPSTVSKTLNRTTRRKPNASQVRIREIATELGYRPNHRARSLSKGCTDILGLYWGVDLDTHDPFFAEIFNGMRAACRQHMVDVLMHGTFHTSALNNLFEELTDGKTDGVVMVPGKKTEEVGQRLVEAGFPVVTITRPHAGIPCVDVDSEAGMRLAAEKIAERGHKSVLYRNVSVINGIDSRYKAFRQTAASLGLTVTEIRTDWLGAVTEQEKRLLALPRKERPTVAVCFNDALACRMIAHCYRTKMSIPDDLAVVGFDGTTNWLEYPLTLTSVRAPWDLVAEQAVEVLYQKIANNPVPLRTLLPVSWVDGDTL